MYNFPKKKGTPVVTIEVAIEIIDNLSNPKAKAFRRANPGIFKNCGNASETRYPNGPITTVQMSEDDHCDELKRYKWISRKTMALPSSSTPVYLMNLATNQDFMWLGDFGDFKLVSFINSTKGIEIERKFKQHPLVKGNLVKTEYRTRQNNHSEIMKWIDLGIVRRVVTDVSQEFNTPLEFEKETKRKLIKLISKKVEALTSNDLLTLLNLLNHPDPMGNHLGNP
ncbi:hypothetical protein HDU81_008596 [Chytriomyces hyalinus]|nr:hypothetical protein HDU81_008596 [Chytriomyces hyalinus]